MTMRLALVVLAALSLAGCNPNKDTGYVEIKAVSAFAPPPDLYLDEVKLDPLRNNAAVIRKAAGAAKLQWFKSDVFYPLCSFDVRKNRVVTLTLSAADRKLKCEVQS